MIIEKNEALSCSVRLDFLGVNDMARIKNNDFPGYERTENIDPAF